ncbi:MAG: hypothetical protein EXX96DRAFT_515105 [Benjaminiella poitrasii]|nr:MAG: hypothetical protein EXX96DRAFT_515105 [Benjaminiella poitrasii]
MYINGLKYACSTCIKGHRSSNCNHTERPLFEIRKKGRPVTQCAYCRDLRKTKQVHIKCACNDKKGTEATATQQQQQRLLIKSNSTKLVSSSSVPKDKNQECTCPTNVTTTAITTTTTTATITSQETAPMIRSSSSSSVVSQLEVTRDTLQQQAPPLCPTLHDEQTPYSWALITSPSANQISTDDMDLLLSSNHHNHHHHPPSSYPQVDSSSLLSHHHQLGFTFHKPTSTQRFLEGQVRPRRRPTTNSKRHQQSLTTHTSNLTIDTTTSSSSSLTTPPSSTLSPEQSTTTTTTTTAAAAMDMQFDYLTEQLETLSSQDAATTEDFTSILNNVLLSRTSSSHTAPSATPIRSHCGSFAPGTLCSQDLNVNTGGESVVITITPLLTTGQSSATTTRIVTCYCGHQCSCPGCLVHPGNFLLGNDPYVGLLPSSSSSCYCSDEEEAGLNKTKIESNPDLFHTNNFMSFST